MCNLIYENKDIIECDNCEKRFVIKTKIMCLKEKPTSPPEEMVEIDGKKYSKSTVKEAIRRHHGES